MDTLIRLLIMLLLSWLGISQNAAQTPPEPDITHRAPITITDVQAVMLESFPPQISLTVSGYQPDGCDFPVRVEQRREGNTVSVELYRDMPVGVMCPMVVLPYEDSIRLDGSFESGTYTIHVNDFTLEVTV